MAETGQRVNNKELTAWGAGPTQVRGIHRCVPKGTGLCTGMKGVTEVCPHIQMRCWWHLNHLSHEEMVLPMPLPQGIPARGSVPAGAPWGHHSNGTGMSNGRRTCLCCTGWKWMGHWCWKRSKTCSERVSGRLVLLLVPQPCLSFWGTLEQWFSHCQPAPTDLINPQHLSLSALPRRVGWDISFTKARGQPPGQTAAHSAEYTCERFLWIRWSQNGLRGWEKSERDTLVMFEETSGPVT